MPMTNLLQNVRYAMRQLYKSPVFTLTAVLTLALGIGATPPSLRWSTPRCSRPCPIPQPDQLVMVWSKIQGFRNGIAAQDFVDWKNQNTVFQDI
jgi:putative ABC transport system permease protein